MTLPQPVLGLRHLVVGREHAVDAADERNPRRAEPDARGRRARTRRASARISGEWNACDTTSALVLMPSARERRGHLATRRPRRRKSRPARPVDRGDRHRARSRPSIAASTRASSAMTDVIAPPAGSACIRPPRAAISLSAVVERDAAGHAHRGDLADAVAHDDVRHDAPRLPQLRRARTRTRRAPAACSRSGSARSAVRTALGGEQQPTQRPAEQRVERPRRTRRAPRGTPAACRRARGPCRRTASPGR